MSRLKLTCHQKAFEINLDAKKYGTFAEIGAGQEVARWFFRVGGASGTIAKTMSAYDPTISDAIYGRCRRYVSRERLRTMLDHEYKLLLQRLHGKRGRRTCFFVFADTVAARSYRRRENTHGWLGIRFQHRPGADPSEIILHVRMLDNENVQQQEALGLIGVNLVHGALFLHGNPDQLIDSLLDDLNPDRIDVDMMRFIGPAFAGVDNRLMSLKLVQKGMTDAVLFTADGEVVQPSEALYKKALLVERGSFRPVTRVSLDMIECARAQFLKLPGVTPSNLVVLMEMSLQNLLASGRIDPADFLARAEMLEAVGNMVLISNYGPHFELVAYLARHTGDRVAMAMGLPNLVELFQKKYYRELSGGIIESVGRLFVGNLKLYVHPALDGRTGRLCTAEAFRPPSRLRLLYQHLLLNGRIEALAGFNPRYLGIHAGDVLRRIRRGDRTWHSMVPGPVARIIRRRRLFGCRN